MTGPAVSKHLRVLERAGLVSRSRIAQARPAKLEAAPLEQVADWAEEFRQFWDERFDRLDDYLTTMPSTREDDVMRLPWPATFDVSTPDDATIVVRREFGAPAWRVWRAMTEPEHMVRWLGNPEFPLTTCEMDVRVGGRYRWVFGSGERSMGVSGTFDEVDSPARLVSTEQFDDFPGPSVNTLLLDERDDGRTAMTLEIRYPDRATRDGWVASGMTDGLGQGYSRLDEVLADQS